MPDPKMSNAEFIKYWRERFESYIPDYPDYEPEGLREALDRLETQGSAQQEASEALEGAYKALESIRLNDKSVYNYTGDGAKNKDGLTPEEGRWATPREIAEDEIKLVKAALAKLKPVADKEDGR